MERISSASAEALMERVAPAIATGSVNVFSVAAVRARSSDRWARTREKVADFVERAFARLAGRRDMIVALNDLEFLTVQPEASRTAALNVSANVLRETLTFFLGQAQASDLKLMLVRGFENGQIAVEDIDLARAEDGEPDAGTRLPSATPPLLAIDWRASSRGYDLSAAGGAPYRLGLAIEPTWNVSAQAVTSFVLRARLGVETPDGERPVARMGPTVAIAEAAAAHALAYAHELLTARQHRFHAGLHVPLPLEALGHSQSRYRILRALAGFDAEARRRLILEVVDLSNGFPPSRMAELVTTLAPHARAVLARAPEERANVAAWRRCGLSGISLDCAHLDPRDRDASARLRRFAMAASTAGPACAAYSLGSRSLLTSAWAAGFTHLGGAAVEAEVHTPHAQRLDASELYRRAGEDYAA